MTTTRQLGGAGLQQHGGLKNFEIVTLGSQTHSGWGGGGGGGGSVSLIK